MAAPATPRALLNEIPGQDLSGRSRESTTGLTPIRAASYQDLARYLICYMGCRVLGALNSGGISTNGATVNTTAIQIDLTTCDILLGGRPYRVTALNDQPIFGTSAWARTIDLLGQAETMPSAEGKTLEGALVAVLVDGAAVLYFVCGAEDDDGEQVAPTEAQIQTALDLAAIAGRDPTVGLILTRIKVARGATTTITLTHGDPAATAALALERHHGCVWPEYAADGLTMPSVA